MLTSVGCDPGTGPDPNVRIEVGGRVERGLTVGLRVRVDGDPVAPGRVRWRSDPTDAVEFPSGDSAVLREAGTVRLEARVESRTGARSLDVALPPTVFFDMVRGGNRDVYRVALDGRELVRITANPRPDFHPSVADGTVVFASTRDGNSEIYSAPSQGGTATRITVSEAPEGEPALSPDGDRLAFVRSTRDGSRLWTAAADGSGAALATGDFGEGELERDPSWAPTGDRLAFTSTVNGTPDLFRWETGRISPLVTNDNGAEGQAAWNAGGGRIVFLAERAGLTADADLFLLELETGEEVRLTDRPGSEGQPAWLPDGRIVFTAFTTDGTELRWLDPANPDESVLIPLDGDDPQNPAVDPAP